MINHTRKLSTDADISLLRRFFRRTVDVGFFITLFAFTAGWWDDRVAKKTRPSA